MKQILRKRNWRRGASLALALLIFMLSALAGITALTMSMANVGRYSHAADDQQPYYTVSSAALLVVDLLDGTIYTSPEVEYRGIREWQHQTDGAVSGHPQSERYTLNLFADDSQGWAWADKRGTIERAYLDAEQKEHTTSDHPLGTTGILTKLIDHCDSLVPYLIVPQEWYSTLRFRDRDGKEQDPAIKVSDFRPETGLDYTFTVEAAGYGDITGRLVMDADFNILLSFARREDVASSDKANSFYSINVYWTATTTVKTDSEQADFTYTGDGETGSQTSLQKKQVTVRWDKKNVQISRGEAIGNEV